MLKPKGAVPEKPPARFITLGEWAIAYFVLGPEDGRPLMLCHGLAANGLHCVADAHSYAERGFRVIVPDLRGHGRSRSPQARHDRDFSILRMAADLIAILDQERIVAIDWVGNSLGGILGLSLMGTDAERLKTFTSFGTAYKLDVPGPVVPFMQLGYAMMGREMLARLGAPMTCKGHDAQAVIYEMLKISDSDAVVRIARHVARYDLIANGKAFGKPMLMIRGALDGAVNAALGPTLAAMANKPNFKLADLPEAGHCANLDKPEKVQETILEFLGAR